MVFCPARDSNPFFGMAEALHFLAGRDDVAPLALYVPRMRDFCDDGETMPGAYGHRWRRHFGHDQLEGAIAGLAEDPGCRRSGVLAMWDARVDPLRVELGTRDAPCNLVAHFQLGLLGDLEMAVFARSNDMVLGGGAGANQGHFSAAQEYVANALGRPVGQRTHVSVNAHFYEGEQIERLRAAPPSEDRYAAPLFRRVVPYPRLLLDRGLFDAECRRLVDCLGSELAKHQPRFGEPFLREVAWPLARAHALYRQRRGTDKAEAARVARDLLRAEAVSAVGDAGLPCDWIVAADSWLERRQRAAEEE